MSVPAQKVCFVVMGFGKKTDPESGRTLDLNATYDAIIRPAVEAENLRCIRADEIIHSGIIDTEMYEMLFRADLVIADISTGNVNSVYELGVRHALRPNSTIIMKEEDGRLYFDLSHVSTFHYRHLGEDIGAKEATRAKRALQILITQTLAASTPDSPVYTYLPNLLQPRLTTAQYETLLDETEEYQETFSEHVKVGNQAMRDSRFSDAARAFSAADKMKSNDAHVIQQLALATYKSKSPSELSALINGLKILDQLKPAQSNDPETLGISGAIHKRLWLLTNDHAQLDLAITFYGRGFDIRRDYYNGENLATCYDYRRQVQSSEDEALFDQMSARKTREAIVEILSGIVDSDSFSERSDKKWLYATFANCLYALGDDESGNRYEMLFHSESPADWEILTYEDGKNAVQSLGDKHRPFIDAPR